MRIVTLFFRTSVKTGAHKRYLELLTEFNKIGHEVLLLHWKDVTYQLPKVQRISFSQKINYHTNDYIECFTIICNRNKIKKEIKNADCIFVFGEGNFLQALLISKILGNIPIITAVRSNFVEAAIKVQKAFVVNSIIRKSLRYINLKRLVLLEKLILKKSQGIILQTEYDARSILQRNPRSTTHYEIVPNSINASWIKENTAEKNRSTVCRKLIYVGSIGKRKGFYFLFTAVRKLIEEGYDISLEVCGKGRKTKEIWV